MGQQLIGVQTLGQNSRRSRGNERSTVRTMLASEQIHDFLDSHRLTVDDRSGFAAFRLQGTAALRANIAHANPFHAIRLFLADPASAMPCMADLAAAPRAWLCGGTVGLDGDFRGGGRGAEKPFLSGPFLIPQVRFETNDFFLQFVNLPLLLKALFAVSHPCPCRPVLPMGTGLMEFLSEVRPQKLQRSKNNPPGTREMRADRMADTP